MSIILSKVAVWAYCAVMGSEGKGQRCPCLIFRAWHSLGMWIRWESAPTGGPEARPLLCGLCDLRGCCSPLPWAFRQHLISQGLSALPWPLVPDTPLSSSGTPCTCAGLIHCSFVLLSLRVRISLYKSLFSLPQGTLHSLAHISAQEIFFPWWRQ